MKNLFNYFKGLKGVIYTINLSHLIIGVMIFGIWLALMTNFSNKLRIMIQYGDHDPMCLDMDSWRIPLENCYWTKD